MLGVMMLQCSALKQPLPVSQSDGETLKERILMLLNSPDTENAFWGASIKRLGDKDPLVTLNGERSFMPASNMKLYTTAAALVLLGREFRYKTGIYSRGEINREGVLHGDIIIQGSGDPSISGRYRRGIETEKIIGEWVDAVVAKGIRIVEGNVIGDDDYFADGEIEGTWENDDLQYWYTAPSSALSINDGCFSFIVHPGKEIGGKAHIEISPQTEYVWITNDVITTGPKAHTRIDLWRPADKNQVRIFGQIPLNRSAYRDKGSVYNGTLFSATLVKEALERRDVEVKGKTLDIDTFSQEEKTNIRQGWEAIHIHTSPPLSDLIRIVNKPSQNFYADMLLKTLGRRFRGEGSFEKGTEVVKDFLRLAGVGDVENFRMRDGSGLSRWNLVQPRQTLRLLEYMAMDAYSHLFYNSLPVAGTDGTLKWRMKMPPAKGNIHAKTGFISYARSLSGYVDDRNGNRWVFCLMCNHYTVSVSRVDYIIDDVCTLLTNYGD